MADFIPPTTMLRICQDCGDFMNGPHEGKNGKDVPLPEVFAELQRRGVQHPYGDYQPAKRGGGLMFSGPASHGQCSRCGVAQHAELEERAAAMEKQLKPAPPEVIPSEPPGKAEPTEEEARKLLGGGGEDDGDKGEGAA